MNPMELDNGLGKVSDVRTPDLMFALHALAVIKVHDDERNAEAKKTLAEIASADEVLSFTKGTLLFAYFISFGRQGVPLLTRILLAYGYAKTTEEVEAEVAKISSKIAAAVF